MRFFLGPVFAVTCLCAFAQTEEAPEVLRAKAGIERLRSLVEAGVAPRTQLEKAEAVIADAEDAALLRRTLYGSDLTEAQTDDMLAAATRRLDRRKQAVDEGRKLVDSGVASMLSLSPLMDEVDSAQKEQELAESRARFTRELAQQAEAEEAVLSKLNDSPKEVQEFADRYDGDGVFNMGTFSRVESEFVKKFGKPLPVSAMGETNTHKSLGFDHRGRVDVAINPDQPEGRWLLEYLVDNHIPYFAFRHAVPGKATGAHIHLGPISTHYKLGG